MSKRNKAIIADKEMDALGANPYLASRRVWNAHYGALVASRRGWQALGIASLLIVVGCVGGLIHIGSQSKWVPYVVEVNKLGETAAVREAQRASPADPRVVRSVLAAFISDVRTVTPDTALLRRGVLRAYAVLGSGSAAQQKTNDWFTSAEASNPFKRAAKETVSVQIDSVLPQGGNAWQVDWVESTFDRQGNAISSPIRMRAVLIVDVAEQPSSASEQQLRDNPLGIFITDYSWSKQL